MDAKVAFRRKDRMNMKNRITTRMNTGKERDRESLTQDRVLLSVSVH